jgi:hypothetical protein
VNRQLSVKRADALSTMLRQQHQSQGEKTEKKKHDEKQDDDEVIYAWIMCLGSKFSINESSRLGMSLSYDEVAWFEQSVIKSRTKVEQTLTTLRNTMTEDRLDALLMLQAHREIIPDTESIISYFVTDGPR